jgi:hypothetical protein
MPEGSLRSPGDIEVRVGFEGFLSYLLPAILVLTGVFVWVTPKQRARYGIIGALPAIYSLVGLNLGSWFVGMLVGTIGALAFAWTPVSTVDASPVDPEPVGGPGGGPAYQPSSERPATVRGPRHGDPSRPGSVSRRGRVH